MGFILESSFTEAFCLLVAILWYIYNMITEHYGYWKIRGIPFAKPAFPFGSLPEIAFGKCHLGEGYDRLYKQFKGERFFGIVYGRVPCLVVMDPELIRLVMTKDFHHFTDRMPVAPTINGEYITQHLFSLSGSQWKRMKLTLGPAFTNAKTKMMFSYMDKCCSQLVDYLDTQYVKVDVVDIKDTLARLTMDIIATCAFGLELNSLSDKNCEFYMYGSKIFKRMSDGILKRFFFGIIPFLTKICAPKLVPEDITLFFSKIIKDTVTYRVGNNIERRDFLGLLIKIRQNEDIADEGDEPIDGENVLKDDSNNKSVGLTMEEIIAQSFMFFLAGFETASSTASFCLYELSRNPDIQERVCSEIKEVLSHHEREITYQALQQMTYMDQVINETLRLYPSLAILNRKSYQVPDSHLVIEKGTRMTIPAFSLHHDPEHFPDPERFNPERFTPEAMRARHPYLHLPFGEGPRMCIAMRFGLLQTKLALATLLYHYKFDVSPETEIPIKIMKRTFTTLPENPLNLRIEKRDNASGNA